jgi:hypothetical protein
MHKRTELVWKMAIEAGALIDDRNLETSEGTMSVIFAVVLSIAGTFFPGVPSTIPGPDVRPVIDNERLTVWDVTTLKSNSSPVQARRYDSVTVYLIGGAVKRTLPDGTSSVVMRKKGDVLFEQKNSAQSEEGASEEHPTRSIVIDLKDHQVEPLKNTSGFPDAFLRPGIKKVLENDRINVWDYTWLPGRPTPMHFHSTDVVVIYLENGAIKSTTPDGKSVINEHSFGLVKFSTRNRVHAEELVKGKARAIMVELK